MAQIVMAYSASHAPMMTADPGSAPREKAVPFKLMERMVSPLCYGFMVIRLRRRS